MTTDAPMSRIMGMGRVARVLRAFVVVLVVAASVQSYGSNFFFYFTILSNLLAVVLLGSEALWPDWMRSNAFFRGAVTLYMTMTGFVYAVVLAPLGVDVGDYAPWANFIHHNLAPTAVLIDWLLFPPRQRLRASALWLWLLFPHRLPFWRVILLLRCRSSAPKQTVAELSPITASMPRHVGAQAFRLLVRTAARR